MPSAKEFEKYLESLSSEEYDKLIQERISRLNAEQQAIAQAREVERKQRFKLIEKLKDPDPDTHQMVFDALRDMDSDFCEHERSIWKHCAACGEMDHLMFPEMFDEDGFRYEDDQ